MSSTTYHLADEPRPGGLAHLAVQPFWPLLAMMLAGSWLALPWFVVNALAVGSPTRGKEIGLAVLAFAGSLGLVLAVIGGLTSDLIRTDLQIQLA